MYKMYIGDQILCLKKMRQKVIKITSPIKDQKLESKDKTFQESKRENCMVYT